MVDRNNLIEIVLDIETVSLEDDQLKCPTVLEERLRSRLEEKGFDPERWRDSLGLSASTGKIVALGLLIFHPGSQFSARYCMCDDDERKILEWFWTEMEGLSDSITLYDYRSYEQQPVRLVTFNGKKFDVPFILLRSALNRILPSFPLGSRAFDHKNHFDLYEYLSKFRSPINSLQYWLEVFGLPSKSMPEGETVATLYRAGNLSAIKSYCLNDCEITYDLYRMILPTVERGDLGAL
jgi:hypothetical protein